MQETLFSYENLTILPRSVEDLEVKAGKVTGVVTATGEIFETSRVVLTTGTFLKGLIHIGCLLYTSPSPRDRQKSRMPSSA